MQAYSPNVMTVLQLGLYLAQYCLGLATMHKGLYHTALMNASMLPLCTDCVTINFFAKHCI